MFKQDINSTATDYLMHTRYAILSYLGKNSLMLQISLDIMDILAPQPSMVLSCIYSGNNEHKNAQGSGWTSL